MNLPLTALQRRVVQQLRAAGHEALAEQARVAWSVDRRIVHDDATVAVIVAVAPDFERANQHAGQGHV